MNLKKLSKQGLSHSILSAQHQNLLDDLVNYYQIVSHFTNIIGLNNHFASSKIENGKYLVKQLSINPKKIVMIGDTDHDFEVAMGMEVDCILISHGHQHKHRLEKTGAMILDNFSSLIKLFFND